jgi:hypothetical protein
MSTRYPDNTDSPVDTPPTAGESGEVTLRMIADVAVDQAGRLHQALDDECCGVKPGGRCCGSKNENATGDDI